MMFFRRKKVTFDKVAKFNYELDTNKQLCRNDMTRTEYLSKVLSLFGKEGLDITLKEFDMLLLLRTKIDQALLERNE